MTPHFHSTPLVGTARPLPPRQTGISDRLVADGDRLNFLPKHFGTRSFMEGEAQVYHWMRRLNAHYSGGYWEYYELSNGGFYLALDESTAQHLEGDGLVTIRCQEGNGYVGRMSRLAAGVAVTMFAVNRMLYAGHDHLGLAFDRLMEFARSHPEARAILSAID